MQQTADKKLIRNDPSQWVNLYSDYLFVYAVARVHSKELAEDIVQDTFLSAVRASDGFKGRSSERTWLTSILKNKIIDHYKKKSTQNEVADEKGNYFETEGSRKGMWSIGGRPKPWDTDYQTPVEKAEFYEILNNCIGNLPDDWGAVFSLKNLEGLDAKEICKELNITSSNYWVIMHRAKLQLRDCMEKNWFTNE